MPWKNLRSDRQIIHFSASLVKQLIELDYPGQVDIDNNTRIPGDPPKGEEWRWHTGIIVGTRMTEEECKKQTGPYGPEVGYTCCLRTAYGDYASRLPTCPRGKEKKYYTYTKKEYPFLRRFTFDPDVCEVALGGVQRCADIGSEPLSSSMSLGTAVPWTKNSGFKSSYLVNEALNLPSILFVDYWLETKGIRRHDLTRLYLWVSDLMLETNKNTADEKTGTLLNADGATCAQAARRAMVHIAVAMVSNACFGEGMQDKLSRLSKASLNSYTTNIVLGYCSGLRQSGYGVFLGDMLQGAASTSAEIDVARKASITLASSLDVLEITFENGSLFLTLGISHDFLENVRVDGVTRSLNLQRLVDKFYETQQTSDSFPNIELDTESTAEVKVVFCRVNGYGFSLVDLDISLNKSSNSIEYPDFISDDVFPAYYKVKSRVKTANPTLTAHLVALNPKMEITDSLCSAISSYHPLVPMACISKLHKTSDAQKAAIIRSCQYSYNFGFSLGSDSSRKPLYRGARDAEGRMLCGCYDADLASVFSREKNITASRCFSSECSSHSLMRMAFFEPDEVCRPFCDKAWEWLHSSNKHKHSQEDQTKWNLTRFQNLCTESIERNKKRAFLDTAFSLRTFLLVAVPCCLLVAVAGFCLFLPHKATSLTLKALFVLVSLGICILLGLATPSYTDCESGGVCRSSLLGTPLPSSFCNESGLEVCECKEDKECSAASSYYQSCSLFNTCVKEEDGYRPTEQVDNVRVHGDVFVGTAAATVCVVAVCIILLRSKSFLVRAAIPPLAGAFTGLAVFGTGTLVFVSKKVSRYIDL